jgi:HEPN domain-containing protein
MQEKLKNTDEIVGYWVAMAENDYNAMLDNFSSKRYNWALFIGHLAVEKLLKACYVKNHSHHAIPTHNLLKIAVNAEIELSEEMQKDLATITTFNINARYDDYKMEFYNRCTPEFTKFWIDRIKTIVSWIRTEHLS